MRLLSHRGLSNQHPENTIAAFAAALALGFDGLETDVRLSADGEAILYHDRLSPTGQAVARLTRTELSHQAGYIVPTLNEALDAFPAAFWNIELKTPACMPNVTATIRDIQYKTPILLSSFCHHLIHEAANTLDVYCALLLSHRPASLNTLIEGAIHNPRLRTLVWDYDFLDPDFLLAASQLGFSHYVYGAKNQNEHDWCSEFGIDGLITDYPNMVGLARGD
ncbi:MULTISPECIES: glycerophosphodiester phosphodiesterase [Deefgea]|nr:MULTISPECIES: glycerophosphodiester phosphodiesterase [Deefgea]MBM9888125.1 glycerophosphodiester phosphodiesterase [Deefgea sp. CFH1-16]